MNDKLLGELPDADTRPSRLPRGVEVLTIALLGLSFISGALFWWGAARLEELEPPEWLALCRIIHGSLNPLLCAVFGYLLCQHIRYGWALKANRMSGFFMEAIMAGLILSAAGLYYVGSETGRAVMVWVHRLLGVALPVSLAMHWIAARRYAKKIST